MESGRGSMAWERGKHDIGEREHVIWERKHGIGEKKPTFTLQNVY
jgi:hypothetical protein